MMSTQDSVPVIGVLDDDMNMVELTISYVSVVYLEHRGES